MGSLKNRGGGPPGSVQKQGALGWASPPEAARECLAGAAHRPSGQPRCWWAISKHQ